MISIIDFEQLSFTDKLQFIKKHGQYLASRTEARFTVSLFRVNSFFTDVWYDQENLEHVVIHQFTETVYLTPYLNLLTIEDIIQKQLMQ